MTPLVDFSFIFPYFLLFLFMAFDSLVPPEPGALSMCLVCLLVNPALIDHWPPGPQHYTQPQTPKPSLYILPGNTFIYRYYCHLGSLHVSVGHILPILTL